VPDESKSVVEEIPNYRQNNYSNKKRSSSRSKSYQRERQASPVMAETEQSTELRQPRQSSRVPGRNVRPNLPPVPVESKIEATITDANAETTDTLVTSGVEEPTRFPSKKVIQDAAPIVEDHATRITKNMMATH